MVATLKLSLLNILLITNNVINGVILDNSIKLSSKTVVLTTGTFLRGLIRIGKESYAAGRIGDDPSINLAKRIEFLKFSIGRLKTGTPPRIDKLSINFNNLDEQKPDKHIVPFSFIHRFINVPQISCFITNTNENTHKTISRNIHLSPMYSGDIKAMGAEPVDSVSAEEEPDSIVKSILGLKEKLQKIDSN